MSPAHRFRPVSRRPARLRLPDRRCAGRERKRRCPPRHCVDISSPSIAPWRAALRRSISDLVRLERVGSRHSRPYEAAADGPPASGQIVNGLIVSDRQVPSTAVSRMDQTRMAGSGGDTGHSVANLDRLHPDWRRRSRSAGEWQFPGTAVSSRSRRRGSAAGRSLERRGRPRSTRHSHRSHRLERQDRQGILSCQGPTSHLVRRTPASTR